MNLFSTIGKIPAAKALIQQLLVTGHAIYVLFKPEIDGLVGHFIKDVEGGMSPHSAAAISTAKMIEGKWSREEEEAANRRMEQGG